MEMPKSFIGNKMTVSKLLVKALTFGVLSFLVSCASSKMSVNTHPKNSDIHIKTIAIAPGSGVIGDAIGIELFNAGATVIDANETLKIIGRTGPTEFEMTSSKGYVAFRNRGIDAVLTSKSVDADDGTPESASVRITSTVNGHLVAGITWQNGWGGLRGSMADRTMRKNLSEAAREIAKKILRRVNIEGVSPQQKKRPADHSPKRGWVSPRSFQR